MIEGGFKTFVAGEDLEAHRRVKLSGTEVIYADAGQPGIGVTEYAVSDGDDVTVRLFTAEGTFEVEAAGTFSAAATLYGADDGKVDDTASGPPLFYAYEAATASGDLIEAIVVHNLDTSDIAVLISDLGTAVGTSDFAAYVSDCATNKSDIVVIKSDRTVSASDITALRSDVTILQSDRTTAESDITVLESDRTTAESDITVLESDRTTAASDRTVLLSDCRVAISDAQVAFGAGDWSNVSDTLVTMGEVLAAFSDALG